MLRTAFSRARAAVQPSSRRLTAVPKSTQEPPKRLNLNTLETTSFSPMNTGVTVSRPFPGDPESTQETPNHAANLEALIAASTSCSPANPGATLPLMSSVSIDLGSRARVLDDIPSILKRFDVPKANLLTQFPAKRVESSQDPTIQQRLNTPQTISLVMKTQPTTTTAAVIPAPRPWFFNLPAFLRPREGTTYYAAFAPEQKTKVDVAGKPNFVQYILYGNPDPDGKMGVAVQKRTLWESIVYGVPDEGGEKVAAKTETVVVGEKKEEVVVMEKEKDKTVEVHEGSGYGMIAK
ncbi:hypothetical protein P171DRAFT_475765 [Karstenula rhodostoma CBS 690.94]|uniref:Uncharacterized protein n=1 Tax=Karstenula rhodostoma CBS 690.94 TaxID=1392251 RepID=A0A9P4U6K9_9PLEO|nr:hypothetical protein P171DRAFT_475765 [Karstenula rhodostoma CBS 690.94]